MGLGTKIFLGVLGLGVVGTVIFVVSKNKSQQQNQNVDNSQQTQPVTSSVPQPKDCKKECKKKLGLVAIPVFGAMIGIRKFNQCVSDCNNGK